MSTPLLSIRHLSKAYTGVKILDRITMDVHAGTTTCLIGPSGAGKSSLLRCINLLDRFCEGEILLDGELIGYRRAGTKNVQLSSSALQKQRRNIGFVFQGFELFSHRTALENVMEGPLYAKGGHPEAVRKMALECLERVGMQGYEHRRPAQLSGGQQQRVAIARSLAMEPKIILFDEPTSALDPQSVSGIIMLIQQLQSQGVTMVIVTHEMEFARQVAHQIVVIDKGRILQAESMEDTFNPTEHRRIGNFIGTRKY